MLAFMRLVSRRLLRLDKKKKNTYHVRQIGVPL